MPTAPSSSAELTAGERARLLRRGLRLEYATLGWNVVEIGFLALAAATARSVALAGFALDSGIEIFASLVVVSQLRVTATPDQHRRAVRLIGVAFLALAAYIVGQAAVTLAAGIHPDPSPLGDHRRLRRPRRTRPPAGAPLSSP